MKKVLLLLGLALGIHSLNAQTNTLQGYLAQAREAYQKGDHPEFYDATLEAHKLHPYHQGILYQAGRAAALNNKPEEALKYLTKAVYIKADFDLSHKDLISLTARVDFEQLKTLQNELQEKVIQSDTAFVIKDKSLHIESIATGEGKNVFYLGSIHKRKILRVDEKGNVKDFTTAGQDGQTSVFGIKVDAAKKILWACSSPMAEMENFDSSAISAVYKYDIRNGKLLERFTADEKGRVFGDLTLDPKGNVFISDSKNNVIFKVNESTGKLEEYFTSPEFWSLQGLTFTPDGQYLFIADYVRGIFRLEVKNKTLKLLPQQFKVSTKSIDGLTFYNNRLIAIQNLIFPMRVTEYILNADRDELTGFRIIDRAHPAFNEPTIGCVAGDTLYYVANSLWSGYDDKRQLKPEGQLQEVVILKSELKGK